MPDDLRQLIDELRTSAKEHFANPTESHYSPRSTRYRKAACAVAFRLADAYDAATAETQRVAGLYRELAAAICGPTMACEDHRILLMEAAKHRGEWRSASVVAKDATIAERDAEIAKLRKALKPFARTANGVPDNWQGRCGLTFVVSSYPSKQTGRRYVYVQSIGGDDVDIDIPTIADWRAADNALKGANRDDDMTCPKCGGSGGGDDPSLRCSKCGGSGQAKGANRDE